MPPKRPPVASKTTKKTTTKPSKPTSPTKCQKTSPGKQTKPGTTNKTGSTSPRKASENTKTKTKGNKVKTQRHDVTSRPIYISNIVEYLGIEKPAAVKWSKEDEQACIIQTAVRTFLSKKKLEELKREKKEYEELMIKLEKEAWLQLVEQERKEEEKERKKEEEERKRKAQETKWRRRMLEAAFDGENNEIITVLNEAMTLDKQREGVSDTVKELQIRKHQMNLVDCEDANNNTPLSEASAGGHVHTIQMLIEKGAKVNSRGRYDRTPLWRAAFAGHLDAVQVLLEQGGDPRLYANDGTTPEEVAAIAEVEQALKRWDITQTDLQLKKMEEEMEKRLKSEQDVKKKEVNRLEKELHEAEKEDMACQKLLEKAHCELNKRIFEHDKCLAEGDETKIKITLQIIHDAEKDLEKAKESSAIAREKYSKLKLKLREQREVKREGTGNNIELVGVRVSMKELDDVLWRDVGGKIAQSGRWPLVIDTSSQTSTFLRYRDTNFLNALNPTQMEPDVIRMALLGAIRYGKPLVVDMMTVDMFESVTTRFNEIQQDLMFSIMTKDILKDDKFLSLVRPGDGEEYSKTAFLGAKIENFKFILLTQLWHPNEELMNQMYPLRVMIPSKK